MFSELSHQRIKNFYRNKKASASFFILFFVFVLSLFSEFIANEKPILILYKSKIYLPIFFSYRATEFDYREKSEARINYLELKANEAFQKKAFYIDPPYSYGPYHAYLAKEGFPPYLPSLQDHWLGTDRQGRDLFARLLYGFRVSMLFALSITLLSMFLGVIIGGLQGYKGGIFDIIGQRFVEIWSALPFLYVVILIGSIYGRSFFILVFLQTLFSWIGISYYMRAEFLRIKNETYINAAVALGLGRIHIFFKQILPNAITPLITLAPFNILGGIGALTALDFLGFGLPPPTPSWGEILRQGLDVIREFPHLTIITTIVLFITLLLTALIGEGLRDAFDPKRTHDHIV